MPSDNRFTSADVAAIATWAAEECDRQRSGELSVGWMVRGWHYAYARRSELPTEADVLALAELIEPRCNDGTSYRRPGETNYYGRRSTGNVRVGYDRMCDWQEVPERMTRLFGFLTDPLAEVDPGDFYRQFQGVHPLLDGNGRTGSVIFNWLRQSLANPIAPPDFWSGR